MVFVKGGKNFSLIFLSLLLSCRMSFSSNYHIFFQIANINTKMQSKLHDCAVILQRFGLQDSGSSVLPEEIVRVERMTESHVSQASVTVRITGKEVTIKVMSQGVYVLRCALFCPFS